MRHDMHTHTHTHTYTHPKCAVYTTQQIPKILLNRTYFNVDSKFNSQHHASSGDPMQTADLPDCGGSYSSHKEVQECITKICSLEQLHTTEIEVTCTHVYVYACVFIWHVATSRWTDAWWPIYVLGRRQWVPRYWVATISRLLKIIGLFCRI